MKRNTKQAQETAAEITVNGYLLHKLYMELRPYGNNTIASLRYPAHRMQIQYKANEIHLVVPSQLAVQLYYQRIISQDKEQQIAINIDGNPIGQYKIAKVIYATPSDPNPETVSFVLQEIV